MLSNGHPCKLLRNKDLAPKKGFDLASFSNSFSLNKIAISIEYNGLASFSISSARLTESAVSTESHDPQDTGSDGLRKFETPRPISPKKKRSQQRGKFCSTVLRICSEEVNSFRFLMR